MTLTEQELKDLFCVEQEEIADLVKDRAEELTMNWLEGMVSDAIKDMIARKLSASRYEKILLIARYAFLMGFGEAMLNVSYAQQESMKVLKEAKAA